MNSQSSYCVDRSWKNLTPVALERILQCFHAVVALRAGQWFLDCSTTRIEKELPLQPLVFGFPRGFLFRLISIRLEKR